MEIQIIDNAYKAEPIKLTLIRNAKNPIPEIDLSKNYGWYDFTIKVKANDWTVVTEDGSLSAHYENTVAILKSGPEILTWSR